MEVASTYPRYKSYKESGLDWLGRVPSHWKIVPLKRVVKEHSGNGFPVELQGADGDIPFLKVSDISKNGEAEILVDKSANRVSSLLAQKKRWNLVPSGALVTAKIGEALRKNHRKILSVDAIIDNNCIGFECFAANPLFNYYLHKIIDFDWFVNPGAVPSISVSKYKAFKVALPELDEQVRIVDFLNHKTAEIDAAIAKKQELIELLKEQKAILINRAVTKGLNPNVKMKDSGVAWVGKIPEHWACTRLGYYARVSNGSTPSRDNPRYWNNGTINWLSSGKVNDFEVSTPSELVTEAALKNTALRLYPKGTVIIGIVGQGKTRGTTAITRIECCINQNMAAIETDSRLNPDYLHRYLFQAYHNIRMMSKGSNQEALNCEIVRSIKTCVPPEDEQDQIVKHIREYERLFSKSLSGINREIERLQEFKQTLITHTTTGKIKV